MEIQLQDLIEQIKKDGVEAAETEAEAIIKAAKEKADKIVADANAKAEKIMQDAKAENDRTVKSGEESLRQAGRNLLISFRESVAKQLEAIAGENVTAVYSSDSLAKLIITVVEGWANKPDAENLEVILNSDDLKKLEQTLLAGLKEKMLGGVTLKANNNFDKGFRIATNNGAAYYDYSAEAVVEMLSNYLSPKVTELLKEAE
ncbi:MAG: V-type ATP synthase subunit E [Clostridia bacterium]|nr:V-type ATP synthase subunit E [Clostridia bacterium]